MPGFYRELRMDGKGSKPKNIKRHNRRLILSVMSFATPFSAGDISQRTNLSKTTVSKLFCELSEIGLLTDAGKGQSTDEGGKKPDLYLLNADYRHVLVINLSEPRFIECTLLNLACEIKSAIKQPSSPDIPYRDAVRQAGEMANLLLEKSGLKSDDICEAVLSCEGIVDTGTGIIRKPAHHKWQRNLPVMADMAAVLGLSANISMDNVCRYGGFAELLFPENRDLSSLIVIWNDDFVGGCVLANGRLVQGSGGLVGELGHMVLAPDSDLICSCGSRGCFEQLISRQRLLMRAYEGLQGSAGSELRRIAEKGSIALGDIFASADRGDSYARSLLDGVIHCYAILIRNISSLYDPQRIIIQGAYASAGRYFFERLREQVSVHSIHGMDCGFDVAPSRYRDEIPRTVGAAYHAIRQYLDSDIHDIIPSLKQAEQEA